MNRDQTCLVLSFRTNQLVSIFRQPDFQNDQRTNQFGSVELNPQADENHIHIFTVAVRSPWPPPVAGTYTDDRSHPVLKPALSSTRPSDCSEGMKQPSRPWQKVSRASLRSSPTAASVESS
jgi:hypothetical protein